jgi:hypothetical protein
MTRFIHLALLTGLLGFSTIQIVACGDDDKKSKKDDEDEKSKKDDDKDDEGGGSDGSSAKAVCANALKIVKSTGEELEQSDAENMASCQSDMAELKTELGDEGWSSFAKCMTEAKTPVDMMTCQMQAAGDDMDTGSPAPSSEGAKVKKKR